VGTTNETAGEVGIAPPDVEVTLTGTVVSVAPSYVNLRREFALNPLPVTPMLVPSFPLTEPRVIEGAFQKIEVNGMFSPKS
jgi:hypothetical protein